MKPDYGAARRRRRPGITAWLAAVPVTRWTGFSYFGYNCRMDTFDVTTAKDHFGRLLDACTQAPVAIEWHGQVVAYVLGAGQMPQVQALETSLDARLAQRLKATGTVYAAVSGSLARCAARAAKVMRAKLFA